MNKDKRKIAVAMSGGVDSSVAAALLTNKYGKENVFGVTMRLFCYAEKSANPKNCCSIESINDAKAVCAKLGIKHYVIDFEKEFEKEVIGNFISEYENARTPNPCVRCNSIVKFDYLLKKVRELGAEYLATGHYARILEVKRNEKKEKSSDNDVNKKYSLLKGTDTKKDQSYFLYGITQEQLAQTLFPLGGFTKKEVRKLASKYDLKTAEKVESQEICFIENNDYHSFLKNKLKRIEEGETVDTEGTVLGRHKGLSFYTIGQRKGLGIAAKEPLYVLALDKKQNRVIVGNESQLASSEFEVNNLNLIGDFNDKNELEVAIRYNMEPQKAKVFFENNKVRVIFEKPQKSITPGQSAVFYDGEEVLGGGIIV